MVKLKFTLLIFTSILLICSCFGCAEADTSTNDRLLKNSIGQQIRAQRLAKGISQRQLADEIGITQNGLSLIEDGLATPIHDKLIAIETFLEVEFNLDGTDKHIKDYVKPGS